MRPTSVLAILTALAVVGVIAFAIERRLGADLPSPVRDGCTVKTTAGTVALNARQMANAATIAAVGIRRELPDRAIVVALATALQESKLENVQYGDRDSVGLFQQRPSQGWGTAEQILDPRYAAGRFYTALMRVKGWQKMRVTEAAQRVQRSAYPEAYQKWIGQAGVLAEALAGRAISAVTCTWSGTPVQRGTAALEALNSGLRLDWGDVAVTASSDVVGLTLAAVEKQRGWQFAHWLVAHSHERSVELVRFGDQEWTASSGAWRFVNIVGAPADRVVAEVYRS